MDQADGRGSTEREMAGEQALKHEHLDQNIHRHFLMFRLSFLFTLVTMENKHDQADFDVVLRM